jgi:hypothetical protein
MTDAFNSKKVPVESPFSTEKEVGYEKDSRVVFSAWSVPVGIHGWAITIV